MSAAKKDKHDGFPGEEVVDEFATPVDGTSDDERTVLVEDAANGSLDEYPIEKGIPIPLTRGPYDWESMEHGDSKVVPTSASSSARSFVAKNRPGWSVTERRVKDDETKTRVWFVDGSRQDDQDEESPAETEG